MAELHAYIVSLEWEGGIGSVQPLVTATPAHAGAVAVANSLRQPNPPTGSLIGVMHVEIPLEWLRWAVRSIESGSTDAPAPLTLVPRAEPDTSFAKVLDTLARVPPSDPPGAA